MIAQEKQESIVSAIESLSDEELEFLGQRIPRLYETIEDLLAEREADRADAGLVATIPVDDKFFDEARKLIS